MLNHFELNELKIFEKSHALLPIGWGDKKKAPMLYDWPIVEGYSIEQLKQFKNAYAVGMRCDNIFCLDIDGQSAVRWARSQMDLLDGANTFEVHRTTSPYHFKHLYRPTKEQIRQIPTNDKGLKDFQFKVRTSKNKSSNEAAEFFFSRGRQVIISGKHFQSGGEYRWLKNRFPKDLRAPSDDEWKKVIRLAEEHLERKPPASKRISSGSWTTPFPCPVCGRAEHLVCQQSSDGDCVRCFVGNSYAPPEGLRKGQVILDGWAFSRLQFVGWGEFAIFVKHKTPPLQKLRRFYP